MAKAIYPIQMVYVKSHVESTWRESYQRTSIANSWEYTGLSRVSGYTRTYEDSNLNSESVAYATSEHATSWQSYVQDDSLHRHRDKVEKYTYNIALLQFDTAKLKAGKPLYLNLYASTGGSSTPSVDLYKITESWDAGAVTYNTKPAMTKLLNSKSLPLNTWVQIDVQSLLGGYGFAIQTSTEYVSAYQKALPKTGDYRPYLSKGSNPCWRVQMADGLKDTVTCVQTANGLKEGAIYTMTINGLKEGC